MLLIATRKEMCSEGADVLIAFGLKHEAREDVEHPRTVIPIHGRDVAVPRVASV